MKKPAADDVVDVNDVDDDYDEEHFQNHETWKSTTLSSWKMAEMFIEKHSYLYDSIFTGFLYYKAMKG